MFNITLIINSLVMHYNLQLLHLSVRENLIIHKITTFLYFFLFIRRGNNHINRVSARNISDLKGVGEGLVVLMKYFHH